MGQYYNIAFADENGDNLVITDRMVEGAGEDYVGAKLMEFAFIDSSTSCAILSILRRGKARIAVIGDYANEEGDYNGLDSTCPTYEMVWGEDVKYKMLPAPFKTIVNIAKKGYIINHTKKLYIDMQDYCKRSSKKYSWSDFKLTINPVILLCALGNGRGGGDYCYRDPVNVEEVGKWIWDVLELVKSIDHVPEGYEKFDIEFYERL